MTKAEFNEAFRKAMSDEFASVPKNEKEIDHVFSDRFEKRMKKLIKAEKSVGWHWVNTAGKRAAVIAAALVCIFFIAFGVGKVLNTTTPQGTPITPAPYVLKEENGKFYMHFSEEYLESVGSGVAFVPGMNMQIAAPSKTLKFSTVSEMRIAFETGAFSDENLAALARRAVDGTVEIPDPNKLLAPDLPAGINVKGVWSNLTYYDIAISSSYNCESENCHYDYFKIDFEGEQYKDYFEYYIVNYKTGAKTIISEKTIEDRNTIELVYTNSTGRYKKLLYQLESNGRTLHIAELYVIEHSYPSHFHYLSETIPTNVKIFCEEDGVSWFVDLEAFAERPSVEWLSSFGVKEIPGE